MLLRKKRSCSLFLEDDAVYKRVFKEIHIDMIGMVYV